MSSSSFSDPLVVGVDNFPPPCSPRKFGICTQAIILMTENQTGVKL